MPGGIIDYWLARDATGPVTLDVLDANGVVVRSYSSDDPVLVPDPALDLEGYDRICRRDLTRITSYNVCYTKLLRSGGRWWLGLMYMLTVTPAFGWRLPRP